MRLSTVVGILTLGQAMYIVASHFGWYVSSTIRFDFIHEDTIFVMHFMTWFIVKSIENLKET